MIKRIFSTTIILAIIAASFLYAGTARQPVFVSSVQAATTNLIGYAGISAYTKITPIDLETVKSVFQMVEYETPLYFIGTVDIPYYEPDYDPLVLVTSDGWIIAFYSNTDPSSKLVDVISKNLDETLLEKAVKIVANAAEVVLEPGSISFYDFEHGTAEKLLLVAEYEPDGNAFTLMLDSTNTYFEKSYAFYRTYYPSFTLDTELMDQIDFVEENADYIGPGYYGTIFGHFTTIDFDLDIENTFAVEAGDHLGFGSLSILFSGDTPITINDKDFLKELPLVDPGFDMSFDLIPSSFSKLDPVGIDIGLAPILSWESSSAPNYEYCIDTSAPDGDIDTDDCGTEWIGVGSDLSVTLSNLKYETTYYWQVRAVNTYDLTEADDGNWYSFTTADGVSPGPFYKELTELKEPTDSLSKVTMTWSPSYGAYYYEVCVDTEQACTAPELWHNVGLATTATIGELLLDSTYYWQVRAWNGFDNLGNEDAGYFTYADSETQWEEFNTRTFGKLRPLPDEVYNITLPLKWEETPIALNGYEYCIDSTDDDICDGNSWKKAGDTSIVVKKLDAGTYFWQVRVIKGDDIFYADEGEWWEFDVLSRKDIKKINVFKVSPLDGVVNQPIIDLNLSWKTTAKSSIGFDYCFFPIDDTDTTPISDDDLCTYDTTTYWVSADGTEATISDLLFGTTYYWQVRINLGTEVEPDYFYADNGEYWAFTTLPE